MQKKKPVGVLDRAIIIIRTLEEAKGDLGLTEVAELSGMNKTTCYRILQVLMSDDLVETGDRPGTYRLGIRFLTLGYNVQKRINIRQVAYPILNELADTTKDTVFLCLLDNDKALCVERIEGEYYQLLTMGVGSTWPLHRGGAARAMLAFLDDAKIHEILSSPIEKITPKTPTDTNSYWKIVQETRERGYSVSQEDVVLGVASIGAPIFNYKGDVIASISVSSATERVLSNDTTHGTDLLINAANRISKLLGWDGETTYNQEA